MKVGVFLVKAFTKDKTQGNPAGVILNADNLSDKQMLLIAKKLEFSESAFVQKSHNADFKIRFFSPVAEVDICGHATLATFYTLVKHGVISVDEKTEVRTQETKAGILPVTCFTDERIMMEQNKPQFFDPEEKRKKIAALLSLQEEDLLDYPIQTVSTGVPKLMIPIKSLKKLFAIKPHLNEIADYCKVHVAKGFYPFTMQTQTKDASFHTRQFNPLAGIPEDPITGLAAGALGCYAGKYGIFTKDSLVIEQGYVLGKGGKIFVDISSGVKVGGYAVGFGKKTIEV